MDPATIASLVLSILGTIGAPLAAILTCRYITNKRKEEHKNKGEIEIIHEEMGGRGDDSNKEEPGIKIENDQDKQPKFRTKDVIKINFKNFDSASNINKQIENPKKKGGGNNDTKENDDKDKYIDYEEKFLKQQKAVIAEALNIQNQMNCNRDKVNSAPDIQVKHKDLALEGGPKVTAAKSKFHHHKNKSGDQHHSSCEEDKESHPQGSVYSTRHIENVGTPKHKPQEVHISFQVPSKKDLHLEHVRQRHEQQEYSSQNSFAQEIQDIQKNIIIEFPQNKHIGGFTNSPDDLE